MTDAKPLRCKDCYKEVHDCRCPRPLNKPKTIVRGKYRYVTTEMYVTWVKNMLTGEVHASTSDYMVYSPPPGYVVKRTTVIKFREKIRL